MFLTLTLYSVKSENEIALKVSATSSFHTGINPLLQHRMRDWFQKNGRNVHINYVASFDRKKQLAELGELFAKFDTDSSGKLDISELSELFS